MSQKDLKRYYQQALLTLALLTLQDLCNTEWSNVEEDDVKLLEEIKEAYNEVIKYGERLNGLNGKTYQ